MLLSGTQKRAQQIEWDRKRKNKEKEREKKGELKEIRSEIKYACICEDYKKLVLLLFPIRT